MSDDLEGTFLAAGEPRVMLTSPDREKLEAAVATLRSCCAVELRG